MNRSVTTRKAPSYRAPLSPIGLDYVPSLPPGRTITALLSTAKQRLGQFVHSFAVGSTANLGHHLLHDFAQVLYSSRA